jgi:hypothetical protein
VIRQDSAVSPDLVTRLERKYGAEWKMLVMEQKLTPENLRTCDADLQAAFMFFRGAEVDSLLEGKQIVAETKKRRAEKGISELYAMSARGEISDGALQQIIQERYGAEIDEFQKDFPQGLWMSEPSNVTNLWRQLVLNGLPPEYDNLVKVFGELVGPSHGLSAMVIQCGDRKLTGLELRDYVSEHPFEVLNPGENSTPSQPQRYVSADEFLADPANGLKETRRPDLIEKRFWSEWRRFLNSTVGKAYANWNTPDVVGLVLDYMKTHDLNPSEQTFRQAASAVAKSISINLDAEVGINHASVVTVSDQGGRAVPVGQLAPVLTNNPDKQWTAPEVHRLVRTLSATDYLALLNSDPTFKHAVNKFGA